MELDGLYVPPRAMATGPEAELLAFPTASMMTRWTRSASWASSWTKWGSRRSAETRTWFLPPAA